MKNATILVSQSSVILPGFIVNTLFVKSTEKTSGAESPFEADTSYPFCVLCSDARAGPAFCKGLI